MTPREGPMSGSMAVEEESAEVEEEGWSIGIGAGREDDPPRETKSRRPTVECVEREWIAGAKPEARTTLPPWLLTLGDRNWRESSGMVWQNFILSVSDFLLLGRTSEGVHS